MESAEDVYMDYINKEEQGILREQGALRIGYDIRELAANDTSVPTSAPTSAPNGDGNDDNINDFTFTDKVFTAWFIVVPPVAAGIFGTATGIITHIPGDYLSDNSKVWLSGIFRFLTLCDAALTSGFSLTYGSPEQITVLQHTITPVWILGSVPATFFAMKKLTWHIGNTNVPLAQQTD